MYHGRRHLRECAQTMLAIDISSTAKRSFTQNDSSKHTSGQVGSVQLSHCAHLLLTGHCSQFGHTLFQTWKKFRSELFPPLNIIFS